MQQKCRVTWCHQFYLFTREFDHIFDRMTKPKHELHTILVFLMVKKA